MAVRNLRYFSDHILRKTCREVTDINESIIQLLDDMAETLYSTKNAAGLAASQIGVLKRLVVIDMGDGLIKMINPEIIEKSGTQECIEGCLSFPNVFGKTIRPQKVVVKALNENNEEIILTGYDELAKCFCHELDHLDGKVFIGSVTEFIDV